MSTLTAAELAAIWGADEVDPVIRNDVRTTVSEIQSGDFVRRTHTTTLRGPKGGLYRVDARRYDVTVAAAWLVEDGQLAGAMALTLTDGRTLYLLQPNQQVTVSREGGR